MTDSTLVIREVAVRAVVAPMRLPLRTSTGALTAAPLVLIDVHTRLPLSMKVVKIEEYEGRWLLPLLLLFSGSSFGRRLGFGLYGCGGI